MYEGLCFVVLGKEGLFMRATGDCDFVTVLSME